MSEVLDRIAISGLLRPEETYVIMRDDGESESVAFFHAIRNDSDLIADLSIILHMLYGQKIEFRRILEVKSIDEDKHILPLLCFDKKSEKHIDLEFVLVRLLSVGEAFTRVMGTLGLDWEGSE